MNNNDKEEIMKKIGDNARKVLAIVEKRKTKEQGKQDESEYNN